MKEFESIGTFFVCTLLTPYHTYDISSIVDTKKTGNFAEPR